MSESVPLTKDELSEIMGFCADFDEPYKSIIFSALLQHLLACKQPPRLQARPPLDEAELLPDLPPEIVQKITSICRQVDCDLRELFNVYKFDPEKVALVAPRKVLGENEYEVMRSVCYLIGYPANLIYGTTSISSKELRASCKEAGVIKGLANFASALKADEALKNAYNPSEKKLNLTPRVVSGGINLLEKTVEKLRSSGE